MYWNLERAAKNVYAETLKSGYDPETGTNWCHLPMEIRLECIKYTDFKSRARLGATSTIEKVLVESKKYYFDKISYQCTYFDDFIVENIVIVDNGSDDIGLIEQADSDTPVVVLPNLVDRMLKFSGSESFEYRCNMYDALDFMDGIPDVFRKNAPLRFENLWLISDKGSVIAKFLMNCAKMDRTLVTIEGAFEQDDIRAVLAFPVILEGKLVEIDSSKHDIFQLVEDWIAVDAEIGKILRTESKSRVTSSEEDMFPDRIVSKKENKVRLSTGNATKHVLMETEWRREIYAIVIPADLPETEEKEWLDKAHDFFFI